MSRFVGLKIRIERTNQSMRTNFDVTLNLDAIEWIEWSDRLVENTVIHLRDHREWEVDTIEHGKLRLALSDHQAIWR